MKNKSLFLGSLLLSMIATSATEAKTSITKNLYTEQYQQEEIEVEGQVLDADGSPMLGGERSSKRYPSWGHYR